MSPEPSPAPPAGRRFLRCPKCGRSDEVTHADLMGHARDGWPTCCGQVTDYFFLAAGHVPPPVHWVAACHICGRAVTADAADMFRYLRAGWPPCCGHPMTFRVERGPVVEAGETKV